VIAQAMEEIKWEEVTETVTDGGAKHKRISVLIDRLISTNDFRFPISDFGMGEEDLDSGSIASSLTIQERLTVLGATSLNTLSIAGQTIFGANMIFSDDGQSIDTLIGNLKLQPLAKAGIDFFNGKIAFNKNGNLEIKEGVIAGNDSMRGQISLEAGQKKVVVTRNWQEIPVTVNLTPSFNTKVWVTEITKDGFTINSSASPTQEEKVYWLAIW